MSKETGGPAFPAPAGLSHITTEGMTLRDYFAAKAMQALMNGKSDRQLYEEFGFAKTAVAAYVMADAMLKVRDK